MEADDGADSADVAVVVTVATAETTAGALKLMAVEWVDDTCMIPRAELLRTCGGGAAAAVGFVRSCVWVIAVFFRAID